ncbi:SGNH/GDSL hydrolase family protein [Mycobacterium sp. LTG2003]
MADRLIAIDTTKPAGSQLPAPVADEIKVLAPTQQLAEAIATRTVFGPRWVFDGDSITINGIGAGLGQENRAGSWTTEFADLAMGRVNYVRNAAVAGQRSDQRLAAFDTDVAPHNPDVVFLTVGTNNVRQGTSMAAWLADLTAYLAKVRGIGAQLVVGAIWPISDTAPNTATAITWNAALYAWAAENQVTLVPFDRMADPATGGWPAGWSSDSIHPTLLDSYSRIGRFAYGFLADKLGPPVGVRRAVTNAESMLPNGFFTTLNAPLGLPHTLSATPSTAAGALPAGTYSYKVTSRGIYGEGLPATIADAVLSGTGQITVAATAASGGSRGVNIYRKGPGDADWKFVYYKPTAEASWVDTGAVAPGAVMTGIDTSAAPTGWASGSSTAVHPINGPAVFPREGVRGNVLRLRGIGAAHADYCWVNVTPGQVLDLSCLYWATPDGVGGVALRWRSAVSGGGSLVGQVYAYQQRTVSVDDQHLVHTRVTVPAGVASVRVSGETFDGSVSYIELAEMRLALVA